MQIHLNSKFVYFDMAELLQKNDSKICTNGQKIGKIVFG